MVNLDDIPVTESLVQVDTEVVGELRHQLGGVGQGSADSVGGVTLTKLCVRSRQWVPVLNDYAKKESRSCESKVTG